MKPNPLLKLCAVASSLLLVAGLVSYRAGALDWMRKPGPAVLATPVAPEYFPGDGDVFVEQVLPEDVVTPVNTGGNQMFYGSKSATVFTGPETTSPPVQPPQDMPEEAVIFSGSKTLMVAPAASEK